MAITYTTNGPQNLLKIAIFSAVFPLPKILSGSCLNNLNIIIPSAIITHRKKHNINIKNEFLTLLIKK